MRAAVLREIDKPMTIEEVELADPGPGEVSVRIVASGVCHSDWNVITGATPNPLPVVLGHEGAGVVEAVGDGVEKVAEGDHVILSWLPSCGECFYCVRGRGVLCDVAMADMFEGTLPGGSVRALAERDVALPLLLSLDLRRALRRARELLRPDPQGRVPPGRRARRLRRHDRLRRGRPARAGGAGQRRRGLRRRRRRPLRDPRCKLAGARTIVAADPVAFKRETALELGATHAVDPSSEDVTALPGISPTGAAPTTHSTPPARPA